MPLKNDFSTTLTENILSYLKAGGGKVVTYTFNEKTKNGLPKYLFCNDNDYVTKPIRLILDLGETAYVEVEREDKFDPSIIGIRKSKILSEEYL